MKKIQIYTDGSCLENPGFGGWAYVMIYEGKQKQACGAVANTTNNQMELQAIIEALKALKEPCEIALFSDSSLMVKGINEWLENWVRKDFKGIKNVALWKEYLALAKPHKIKAFWLKAHNNHEQNELCDSLARKKALELKKSFVTKT